jgi:hypothetical protein
MNIQDAVDYLITHSKIYAQAKADLVYMEEMRKTVKAELMQEADHNGVTSAVSQEREAYAHPRDTTHLEHLQEATRACEQERWMLIAAQARLEVWRSLEASNRAQDRSLM